ncbi:MAG: cysteine desulfurase [Candidatus Krumholzibacteriota bacterium]|nr:cysteine desulfurase [Candidatus Krumholzibacteriota bacterium]
MGKELQVYFDHNATTSMRQEVIDKMSPYFSQHFGNASSLHFFGIKTREAIDIAREQVALLINADPDEIIFTSGGTESDNLAIRGVLSARRGSVSRAHIITSSIEHPAVLETCAALEKEGIDVTFLPSSESGTVDPSDLEAAIRPDTILVSVMLANNETGVIQPVRELSQIAGNKGITFHVDAVQGVGKIPVDVDELGIDLLTISAHKFYGPKGIGALYRRKGTKIDAVYTGGHHEYGLRPGTENVPAIVGFGEACRISKENLSAEMKHIARLRDRIEIGITERIEKIKINGAGSRRVPNTCSVTVTRIEGEAMTMYLSMLGFGLSSGSACATGDSEPSHVLLAMGLDPVDAQGALRISLGIENTDEDVDAFLDAFPPVVERLREMSPVREES